MVGDEPPAPEPVTELQAAPKPLAVFGRVGTRPEFNVTTEFGFIKGYYRKEPSLLPFPGAAIVEVINEMDRERIENFGLWYKELNALRPDQMEDRMALMIGPIVNFAAGLRYEMSATFRGAIALAKLLHDGIHLELTDKLGRRLYTDRNQFLNDFIQRWKLGDSKGRTMRLIKAAELWLELEGAGLPVPPNLSRLEDLVPLGNVAAAEHYRALAVSSGGKAPSYTKIRVLTKKLRNDKLTANREGDDRPRTLKEHRQQVQMVVETLNVALSAGPMDLEQVKAAKAQVEKLSRLLQPPPQKPKAKKAPSSKPPVADFTEVDLSALNRPVVLQQVKGQLLITYPADQAELQQALAMKFTANAGWGRLTAGVMKLRMSLLPAEAHAQTAAAARYLLDLAQLLKIPSTMISVPKEQAG